MVVSLSMGRLPRFCEKMSAAKTSRFLVHCRGRIVLKMRNQVWLCIGFEGPAYRVLSVKLLV
jgi:hypothetical protein